MLKLRLRKKIQYQKGNTKIIVSKKPQPLIDTINFEHRSAVNLFVKEDKGVYFGILYNDEHELNRLYKGQTYITIPFKYNVGDDELVCFKRLAKDAKDYNGLMKISKRFIRNYYGLKTASKEAVLCKAYEIIDSFLSDYSCMLNDYIFDITISNDTTRMEFSRFLCDKEHFVEKLTRAADKDFKDTIEEFSKSDEFISLFKHE